jgi:hypothetical protein
LRLPTERQFEQSAHFIRAGARVARQRLELCGLLPQLLALAVSSSPT